MMWYKTRSPEILMGKTDFAMITLRKLGYCKATIVHEGFNFTNAGILRASLILDAVKIKFLYYSVQHS